jgi:hypothetical protein
MQLEAEKTSHRTFTLGCQAFECPVGMFAFDVTHEKRGGINEGDAGAFTQTAQLQEKRHFYNCFLLQFHKTAVADRTGKILPAVYLNVLSIKGFQVSELFEVEQDKNVITSLSDMVNLRFRLRLPLSFFEDAPALPRQNCD